MTTNCNIISVEDAHDQAQLSFLNMEKRKAVNYVLTLMANGRNYADASCAACRRYGFQASVLKAAYDADQAN